MAKKNKSVDELGENNIFTFLGEDFFPEQDEDKDSKATADSDKKQHSSIGQGRGRELLDKSENESKKYFDASRWAESVLNVLKAKGIPVGEFERQVGLATGQLSRFKNGTLIPKIDVVFRISQELDIDVNILEKGSFKNISQEQIDKVAVVKALKEDTVAGKLIWRNIDEPFKFAFYNRDASVISGPLDKLTEDENNVSSAIDSFYPDYEFAVFQPEPSRVINTYISQLPDSSTYVVLIDDESTGLTPKGEGLVFICLLDAKVAAFHVDKSEIFEAFKDNIIEDGGGIDYSYSREEALALMNLVTQGEKNLKPKTSTEKAILDYMNSRK